MIELTKEEKIKYLDLGLRMLGIQFDLKTIEKIVLLMKLFEFKGGEATMEDVLNFKQ